MRVRLVALALGVAQVDRGHLGGVAGGRADPDAALAQRRDRLERARDQLGIGREAFELQRHEVLEHGVDVVVVGQPAVGLLPAPAHRIELGDLLDVDPLVGAHRRARLGHA